MKNNKQWIGYHYTGIDNWKQIKKDKQIKPYVINKSELKIYFPFKKMKGIWIWDHKLKGLSHAGSVIYQTATKNVSKVVLLKIVFSDSSKKLKYCGSFLNLFHNGNIEKLIYHRGEKATIWTKSIPVEWITEIREFDIVKLLK